MRWRLPGLTSTGTGTWYRYRTRSSTSTTGTTAVSVTVPRRCDDVLHFRPHSAAVHYPGAACRHAREVGARRASPRARRVRHPSRCRLQIILANRAVEIDSLDDVIRDRSCILVDQNAGSGNSCGMHSREDVCGWQPAKTA